MRVISLFSGAGGFDLGFVMSGHEIKLYDVSKEDVIFDIDGSELLISYGEGDSIRVELSKNGDGNTGRLEIKDGYYMEADDINRVVQQLQLMDRDRSREGVAKLDEIRSDPNLMNVIMNSWRSPDNTGGGHSQSQGQRQLVVQQGQGIN